jgi:hypothetical protein
MRHHMHVTISAFDAVNQAQIHDADAELGIENRRERLPRSVSVWAVVVMMDLVSWKVTISAGRQRCRNTPSMSATNKPTPTAAGEFRCAAPERFESDRLASAHD